MYLLFNKLIFILKKKNHYHFIKLLVIKLICFKITIDNFTCNIIKYTFKN